MKDFEIKLASRISIEYLRNYFKMKRLDIKERSCLRCDVKFVSDGPQNRICHQCSLRNDHVATAEESAE